MISILVVFVALGVYLWEKWNRKENQWMTRDRNPFQLLKVRR